MLKDENTRLRVLAEHDWLTGLYNRRAAEAHVDEALLKNGGGMLLVLDIDHFKQVNDRYGHLIGDALLSEAARTLRDIFFPRDIIGRVGGDEFIIYILGGCSQEAVDGRAAQLAERLRKAGRRYGMQWNLSFTLGLAEKQAGDDYIPCLTVPTRCSWPAKKPAAPAVQTVRMPEESAASAQTWRSSGVSCGKKTRPKARSVRITRPSNRSTVLWSAASSAAGRAHILS